MGNETATTSKVFKYAFDMTKKSWIYTMNVNGAPHQYEFILKDDVLKKSNATLPKVYTVSVYDKTLDDARGKHVVIDILNNSVPTLWPDRDPHKISTPDEDKILIHVIMRDAMMSLLQKMANGWVYNTAKETNADNFDVEFVTK